MLRIITKFIISIILITLVSFVGIYVSFIYGLKLNNLNFYNIHIKQLYIKIDKKFILRGKDINIETKNDSKTDFKKINYTIVEVFKWLSYFQEINIKNIKVSNQTINYINYKHNIITFDTDLSALKATIYPNINKTKFDISYINLKLIKEKLTNIKGYYIPKFRYLDIYTSANLNGARINSNIKIYKNKLILKSKIKNITDIKRYKKFIPKKYYSYISDTNFKYINVNNLFLTYNFITSKVKLENINASIDKLNYLKNSVQRIDFKMNRYFDINMKLLNTSINEYNISARINHTTLEIHSNNQVSSKIDDINMVLKDKTAINLKNITLNENYKNQLNIFAKRLNYKKNNLNIISNNISSQYLLTDKLVTIPNIDAKYKTTYNKDFSKINLKNLSVSYKKDVQVSFDTNATLSKNLIGLLKEFNVSLPLYQKKANNNIFVNMDFGKKFTINLDLNTTNSILNLKKGVDINIKKAQLNLKNSLITLKNSDIEFNKSILNVNYDFNGTINLSKDKINLHGIFKKMNLKNILTLNNFKENIAIDLHKLNINLQNLSTDIAFNPIKITINKLSKYTPYYKLLNKFGIKKGFSNILIDKNITISAYVTDTNQTIILKNNKAIKEIATKIILDKNVKIITTKDLKVIIKGSNNYNVKMKNLDINVTQFLDKPKNDKNETNKRNENNQTNKSKQPIFAKIDATNSSIIYKHLKLYSKNMKLDLKDDNMTFVSLNDDNNITAIMKNGNLKIYGIHIDKKTFQNITKVDPIKDILLNFLIIKYKNSSPIYGFVDIKRGYIKQMKLLNNLVAFINTIPSLLTFSALGYSNKGFKIKKGYISFIKNSHYIYFKKIYIKGDNLSFKGNGYIDTKNNKIKMNLDANIFIKLVNKIPLVGYILLGKDGGITIKTTIEGNLSNPTIHKNTLQNIIESPFGLIYRTITSPFHILDKKEE